MKVTLVGLGMGEMDTLTLGGRRALEEAELVIGAPRLLAGLPPEISGRREAAIRAEEILACIQSQEPATRICVVYSGDLGFYSGAKSLRPLLAAAGIEEESYCGITTVQYLAARLGLPWQDLHLVSAHGTDCDVLAHVLNFEQCFFLTGGLYTPEKICRELVRAGLGRARAFVAERLSYPEERITQGTVWELSRRSFDPLSALLIRRQIPSFSWPFQGGGIPDKEFIRGSVPMTKREVRCQIMSFLQLEEKALAWDVGSGTGSVAVEMALAARWGRIYAVEENPEAQKLLEANRKKFGVYNLIPVPGRAPEALAALPAPAAVFVGGSKGSLKEILAAACGKNPRVRIVVSAIMLETLQAAWQAFEELGLKSPELCQLAVSRGEKLGRGHFLKSLNPIFLLKGGGDE